MMEDKIKSKKELKSILDEFKKQGKKIVFTNGCFDIIHYGHVSYLEKAKKEGDILVVGLNSDESVRKIKGQKRPVIDEKDRAGIVAALESVDYVTIFEEETPLALIKYILPDVLAKGGDWEEQNVVGRDIVKNIKGKVAIIPFVEGKATTNIINKIKNTL